MCGVCGEPGGGDDYDSYDGYDDYAGGDDYDVLQTSMLVLTTYLPCEHYLVVGSSMPNSLEFYFPLQRSKLQI